MARLSRILVGVVLAVLGVSGLCTASQQDVVRYFEMIEAEESSGDCGARSRTSSAIGCYQLTDAALKDIGLKDVDGNWIPDNEFGIMSEEEFLADPAANAEAALAYTKKNWGYLMNRGTDGEICRDFGDFTLDAASLLLGAHMLGWSGVTLFIRCVQGALHADCLSDISVRNNGGDREFWRDTVVRRMTEMAHAGLDVSELTPGNDAQDCSAPISSR